MIKSILVHIPTERPIRPVTDVAISLAQTSGAELDALSLGYISTSAAFVVEGAAATVLAANLDLEQQRAAQRTAAALAVFEVAARNAGVSYRSHSIEGIPADAADAIGAAARLHDLSVVLQPDVDRHTFDNTISRDILLQAGGPVLFVPYIFNGPFQPKRIGICWDGSRLASRALRDAHLFLARANYLCALSIDASGTTPAEASLEKLGKYLARYGHPTKLVDMPGVGIDIQPLILSLAADENLDMLVLGAYGHSPLREGILGGVTRAMMQTMTLPTLMSH
ncbi:MAG: universal stress protein [Proteobacteria bacterium]|nr:universal stress protein [Pseudomonadota bacterium]